MRLLLDMINRSFYNKSLVRRGEVILDFDVIDSWYNELNSMNNGKRGAQYHYPDSFIQLLGYMRVYFHLPYGIKVANRGEWIRHKWHVRRGYLKIHVAVNIKNKKIISLEVTSEEVHDGKMLKKLVDNASANNNVKGCVSRWYV